MTILFECFLEVFEGHCADLNSWLAAVQMSALAADGEAAPATTLFGTLISWGGNLVGYASQQINRRVSITHRALTHHPVYV